MRPDNIHIRKDTTSNSQRGNAPVKLGADSLQIQALEDHLTRKSRTSLRMFCHDEKESDRNCAFQIREQTRPHCKGASARGLPVVAAHHSLPHRSIKRM
jgi:hypothetical protein